MLVGYGNYLTSIFKNIYENIRNKRKMVEKLRGVPTKLPISPATYSRVSKLVLYQYLDIELLPYGRIGEISNLNIHDLNFNEISEMNEKSWKSQGVFLQNYSYLNC